MCRRHFVIIQLLCCVPEGVVAMFVGYAQRVAPRAEPVGCCLFILLFSSAEGMPGPWWRSIFYNVNKKLTRDNSHVSKK